MSDYANRAWAGLVSGFYAPRWRAWLARLAADLEGGAAYDAAAWRAECLVLTREWVADSIRGPRTRGAASVAGGGAYPCGGPVAVPLAPAGDAVALAAAALERWGPLAAAWAREPALTPERAPLAASAAAAAAAVVGAAAKTAADTHLAAAAAAAASAPTSPLQLAPSQAVQA